MNIYRVDGFMSAILITHEYDEDLKNEGREMNRAWIFFEKDPLSLNYNYYAVRVQESNYGLFGADAFIIHGANRNIVGNPIGRYMVSEGQVNQNYQPLYISSKTITIPSKLFTPIHGELLEVYNYDSEGNNVAYMYAINRKMVRESIKRVVDNVTIKRTIHHNILNNLNEFYVQENGYEARMIFNDILDTKEIEDIINIKGIDHIRKIDEEIAMKNGIGYIIEKINYIKEDLYIKYAINYDIYEKTGKYTETGKYTIYGADEVVSFNTDGRMPESRLHLDFDIYPDNRIFENQYPDSITSSDKRMYSPKIEIE
jgi:hypothetical protein